MRTALALVLVAACGSGKSDSSAEKAKDAQIPSLAMPALGVETPAKMNFLYGPGEKPYEKVQPAYKKSDWPAVKAACEETLAKDPGHLDAERNLGTAMAQAGDFEGATPHLVAALAGDFLRYGPKLPEDKLLTDYLSSPWGKALLALELQIKADFEKQVAGGIWLLGRRSTFKWPAKSGGASTRGELYAYDEDGKRFLRITHTDHQLAAWLPSPAGDEIALVGYDKATIATDKITPPSINAWVETIDARTFETRSHRAVFKTARAISVTWGPGGQLLVDTVKPQGRWGTLPDATWSIDATTGKLAKTNTTQDPAAGRVRVSLDEVIASGAPAALKMTPSTTDPSLVTEITVPSTSRTIGIQQTGLADGSVPRLSPSGARVAFAVWADPCSDNAKPTLYIADAKTGELKHVLTAGSRFNLRWLSDDRLMYEDGSGGLRIYDAAAGRETGKVPDKTGPGVGLAGLSASPAPICHAEPLAQVETGEEDPLPPEEGGGDDGGVGPVTSP